MSQTTATEPDLTTLRPRFRGELLTAADGPAYDAARAVFNAMFDRRPAVIARVTSAEDVAAAIAFARRHRLPLAVRGGGHSVAGFSTVDDGLVLDLGAMRGIEVDSTARRVRVQPGATWGELDRTTQEHGLATTGGRMTTTGVAGFTLGSGSGWLERRHGLACDNLVSAQVVLADGRRVTADSDRHPDLFWALKGGGGNFGVVTELEIALHPVGPVVTGGLVMHPRDRAVEVCRSFRDFMRDAPRDVGGGIAFMHAPPAPFVPAELRGRPVVAVIAAHFGPLEEGADALRPLRELGAPAVDTVGSLPYVQLQAITDAGNPPGRRNYWRSGLLPELPDEAIDTLVACATVATSPASQVILGPLGGAVGDVAEGATAIGGRDAAWVYHCYGIWTDAEDDERQVGWVRSTEVALRPFTGDGIALNFLSDLTEDRVRRSFGAAYARLQQVKARYDPDNVFRLNQNVAPPVA